MLLNSLPDENAVADILIVGGGAVGLAMAIALTKAGGPNQPKVLVVESGNETLHGDYPERNARDVIQTGARHHNGAARGRYRGLGGTTRLWGGQLMPFTAADLSGISLRNKPAWPIPPGELLRWVDEAMRLFELADDWDSLEARFEAITGSSPQLNSELRLSFSAWLPKPDFLTLWGAQLRAANGPGVLIDHEAIGLDMDASSGRVTGVRLRGPAGEVVARGREIVLACGTLETARLLLRAQAALPASPLARNRHVGKWFFDHLHGIAGQVRPHDRDGFGRLFDASYTSGRKLLPKVRLADEIVLAEGLPNCAGMFTGAMGVRMALAEMRSLVSRVISGDDDRRKTLHEGFDSAKVILPLAWRYVSERRSSAFLGSTASFGCELEQLPSRNSYLALETGVPADHARLAVHWTVDGGELDALVRMCEAVERFCHERGLGAIDFDPRIGRRDASILDDFHDSSHQMGGARMAASAEDGVVDGQGAVFGMPGLHVAGAPTFPSGSFANPTLMAIAQALRLAAHLVVGSTA